MTSEVALMNRMAVALAADSATTVRYFEDGERKKRYFKGANKIFNLSVNHPVGLMINGSASLQRMPWEVIVKQYRDSRGAKAFDTLSEHADDFFSFLKSRQLFPSDYQERQLISGISQFAGTIVQGILREKDVKSAGDPEERKRLAANHLAASATLVENMEYISELAKKAADTTEKSYLDRIGAEFKSGNLYLIAKDVLDVDAILRMAAHAFFKADTTSMENSGIVVAGYGASEVFPRLEQYDCYGVLLNNVIFKRVDDGCRSIGFDAPSEIVPIAQDVMAYTFMFGASVESIVQFQDHFQQEVDDLISTLVNLGHLDPQVDVLPLVQAAAGNFRGKNRDYVHKDASRLRRVIGMMPVGELAELAETLVSLESLKERTTKESESVSGPIDVAVITKGDGFIWVKRKHYFDPALNLRFVAKKHSEARQ